jgi:hypothetical protein
VRRATAPVSANLRRNSLLIARPAVHHCAPLQLVASFQRSVRWWRGLSGNTCFPSTPCAGWRRRFRRNSASLAQRHSRSVRLCDKNRPFVTSGHFERRSIAERTKDGIAAARARESGPAGSRSTPTGLPQHFRLTFADRCRTPAEPGPFNGYGDLNRSGIRRSL